MTKTALSRAGELRGNLSAPTESKLLPTALSAWVRLGELLPKERQYKDSLVSSPSGTDEHHIPLQQKSYTGFSKRNSVMPPGPEDAPLTRAKGGGIDPLYQWYRGFGGPFYFLTVFDSRKASISDRRKRTFPRRDLSSLI